MPANPTSSAHPASSANPPSSGQPPSSVNAAGPDESRARHQLADRLSLARAQQGRGQLTAALETLDAILAAARDAGLTGSATVLTARRLHAEVHFGLGHPDEAYDLAEELYRDCAARLPARHPATLRTAVLLAGIAYLDGDLDTTEQLCRWVLGESDAATTPAAGKVPAGRALLLASVHLALVGAARGELRPALAALTPALRVLRERYGGHDPDTLRVSAELADLYHLDGDDGAAQRLLTRAHHDAHGHFGPDHPITRGLDAQLSRLEPPMPSFDRPATPESAARRGTSRRQARVAKGSTPRRPLFSRKPRGARPPEETTNDAVPAAGPPLGPDQDPTDLPPADWQPADWQPAELPARPAPSAPPQWPVLTGAPGVIDLELPQDDGRAPAEVEPAPQFDERAATAAAVTAAVPPTPSTEPNPADYPNFADQLDPLVSPESANHPRDLEPWPHARDQGAAWQEHARPAADAVPRVDAEPWADAEPSATTEPWAAKVPRVDAEPWADGEPWADVEPWAGDQDQPDEGRRGAEVQWYPRLDRPALPAGREPERTDGRNAQRRREQLAARLDALAPKAERRPSVPEPERAVWTPAASPPQVPRRRPRPPRQAPPAPQRTRQRTRPRRPWLVQRWRGRVRRRPEAGTAPRRFRVSWTVAVAAMVLGLGSVAAAAGVLTAVGPEHNWHAGGATPAPAPSAATGPTGAAIPGDLTIRAGSGAGEAEIDVGWTDPTGGEATPVLVLTDVTGNRVATVTLAPGTTSYRREHLAPGRDYCVLIALYLSAHDGAAVGRSACTHNFVTS